MRTSQIALLLGITLVCTAVFFGTVRYTNSDPRGTLLLSDSIIFHGSFKLDHYGKEELANYGQMVHSKNGHQYYFFPIGTSLVSIPVVWVAKLFSYSYAQQDEQLQIFIACITAGLTVLFLARLAALFLTPLNATFISLVFWLGTSLASTGGTALWSHNFAALFGLMAIYYGVKPVVRSAPIPWHLIALLLFFAYLCRPTMALLSPFLLLFLAVHNRKSALQSGALLALLLVAFSGWSYYEFAQPLPDYYLPKRLSGGDFAVALAGHLISPSRGLLVYSSIVALVWVYRFAAGGKPACAKPWWLLIALGWPLSHLIFISRFPHWWGGWSYGSRFMMDILPGLFLLVLMAWPRNLEEVKSAPKTMVLLMLACVFAIYINTVQGLYNRYTAWWSSEPNIDMFPVYLFDWKYPQFLHNQVRHEQRTGNHRIELGIEGAQFVIYHDNEDGIVFTGWSPARPTHRWSDGNTASIQFVAPKSITPKGTITIGAMYFGEQRVKVKLNNFELDSYNSSEVKIARKIPYPPEYLVPGQWNTLTFELPDARSQGEHDPRLLAVGLKSIAIR